MPTERHPHLYHFHYSCQTKRNSKQKTLNEMKRKMLTIMRHASCDEGVPHGHLVGSPALLKAPGNQKSPAHMSETG